MVRIRALLSLICLFVTVLKYYCLSLGCCNQIPDRVTHIQHLSLLVPEAGSSRSRCQPSWALGRALFRAAEGQLLTMASRSGGVWTLSRVSSTTSSVRPSWPNCLQRPRSWHHHPGHQVLTRNFRGGPATNIQSPAGRFLTEHLKVVTTKDLAESENPSVLSPHRRRAAQRSVSAQSCTDPQRCSRSTRHGSKTQGRHPWPVAHRPLFCRS